MNLLLVDAQKRPELFHWNGAIDPNHLGEWLAEAGLQVPSDLEAFYHATGGVDFFESETIFGPFGDRRFELQEDRIAECERHRSETETR